MNKTDDQTAERSSLLVERIREIAESIVDTSTPEGKDLLEAAAKLERLRGDYARLARWAGEQNAGNAFAEQVAMYALARLDEWDFPVNRWEP